MPVFKHVDFADRLSTAATAKKALLEKFRAKSDLTGPAVAEREAARQAIIVAREARAAEREVARQAKLAREAEEQAAREAALEAERAAREAEAAEKAAREVALEAERKAARDARYAARKARK